MASPNSASTSSSPSSLNLINCKKVAVETAIEVPLYRSDCRHIDAHLIFDSEWDNFLRYINTYISDDGKHSSYPSDQPAGVIQGLYENIGQLYEAYLRTEAKSASQRAQKAAAKAQAATRAVAAFEMSMKTATAQSLRSPSLAGHASEWFSKQAPTRLGTATRGRKRTLPLMRLPVAKVADACDEAVDIDVGDE